MDKTEKVEEVKNGGRRPGSGRKPGVPNKLSSTVKENVIEVFNRMGGVEQMAIWATDNPNQFYNIYAKILPMQTEISGIDGSPIPLSIGIDFVTANSSVS